MLKSPLSSNASVVDQIVDRITQSIIDGEVKPGDKIPTEMELCEALQVGRNSVREAIKILVAYGVLTIRRSEGTFVCKSFNQRMLNPMLFSLILEQDSSSSLLELRQIIDTGVLKLAVDKASPADIHQINLELKNLEREILKSDAKAEKVLDADIKFHGALAHSVHNKLVINMAEYINRLTIPSRVRTQRQILESGDLTLYINLHREILATVEDRDASRIAQVVESHYTYWRNEV